MKPEEQNIAQFIFISLENTECEWKWKQDKKQTQENLWFGLTFYTVSSRMSQRLVCWFVDATPTGTTYAEKPSITMPFIQHLKEVRKCK